jgi:hypothetical protein
MSNNLTANQKAQGTNTPTPEVAIPQADTSKKNQQIITVEAEEVKVKPSVQQIFERMDHLRAMKDVYEKHVNRQKELIEFEAEASDESGFVLRCTLKSGTGIEFVHTPSNLDFVREQIRKNDANIKMMEAKIQEFNLI